MNDMSHVILIIMKTVTAVELRQSLSKVGSRLEKAAKQARQQVLNSIRALARDSIDATAGVDVLRQLRSDDAG